MTCRNDQTLGYRVLPTRHDDACASDLCRGCQPCETRHCCVGQCWEHTDDQHPQTCAKCVGRVRSNLERIEVMHQRLREETLNQAHDSRPGAVRLSPMGGDAMAMISPVSTGEEMLRWALWMHDYEDLDHAALADDPPLLTLATWEEAWRDWLAQPTDLRATVNRVVGYLCQHLTMMAQQFARTDDDGDLEFAPDFAEFAADVSRVRGRVESVLAEGVRPVVGVACFTCGSDLIQVYDKPSPCPHLPEVATEAAEAIRATVIGPLRAATYRQAIRAALGDHWCDQGGRRDDWKCSNAGCGEVYDADRYQQARAQAQSDRDPLRSAGQIEAQLGIKPATLRRWVARGEITQHPGQRNGWAMYDIHEVRGRAMHGGLLRGA